MCEEKCHTDGLSATIDSDVVLNEKKMCYKQLFLNVIRLTKLLNQILMHLKQVMIEIIDKLSVKYFIIT